MQKVRCLSEDAEIAVCTTPPYFPKLECPFCHSHVKVELTEGLFTKGMAGSMRFVALFPCCGEKYFVECDCGGIPHAEGSKVYNGWRVVKAPTMLSQVPEAVKKISPLFEKNYNEARSARVHGLNQVAGPGLRKALEFLLKDYAIYLSPDKKVEIKAMELGQCISLLSENKVLRDIADRAAWLGNDQVHYECDHKDKDINDLEALIEYVMSLINLELIHPTIVKEIKRKKRPKKKQAEIVEK